MLCCWSSTITHRLILQLVKGWKNDQEERREEKLIKLRRRGKGPPKKGVKVQAGKKKK